MRKGTEMDIDSRLSGLAALALLIAWSPLGAERAVIAAPARVDKAEIDAAVAVVSGYDHGSSRKPLRALEDIVRRTYGNTGLRAHLEQRLVRLLGSDAPLAARQFACRQLWTIGTEASVPVLSRMLLDGKTAEMACYALARQPSPKVDAALREALGKLRGRARVAVLNLLGERRDAASVGAAVKLARSSDGEVAAAAAAALGKIATDRAVEALVTLHQGPDENRRDAAAHALLECAQEAAARGRPAAARAIYERLGGAAGPPVIRRGALMGQIELGGPEAVAVAVATLRGKDSALKAAALAALSRAPGDGVDAAIADAAKTVGDDVRADLHRVLSERRQARATVGSDALPAVRLFDGKTLDGWEGNEEMFRVERGAIVAGTLEKPIPRNEFLCTKKEYGDFELRLQVKLIGAGRNAGIQFRSHRVPGSHEVSGYQADMGKGCWGCLYDESRRRRMLATVSQSELAKVLRPGEWNEYAIRCAGERIQLWINGYRTVDYTEREAGIERRGIIGLQIHGGQPSEAWYRDIVIRVLR
jgi:HEAT repeat protein